MNKKVVAQFDSVDMATIAARNVANRIKGITDINIAYDSAPQDEEADVFKNFFIPQNYMSGIFVNENFSYPAVVAGDRQEDEGFGTKRVFVEVKTPNDTVRNIETNLRAFGGTHIKTYQID